MALLSLFGMVGFLVYLRSVFLFAALVFHNFFFYIESYIIFNNGHISENSPFKKVKTNICIHEENTFLLICPLRPNNHLIVADMSVTPVNPMSATYWFFLRLPYAIKTCTQKAKRLTSTQIQIKTDLAIGILGKGTLCPIFMYFITFYCFSSFFVVFFFSSLDEYYIM